MSIMEEVKKVMEHLHLPSLPMLDLPPLAGSLIYYTVNILFFVLLLRLNSIIIPKKLQVYFGNFLTTMLVCSASLENANLYRHFGSLGLFGAVFTLGVVYYHILPGWSGNPVTNFRKVFTFAKDYKQALVLIPLQLIAGLVAYRYAKAFWFLEIHEYHRMKFTQISCFTGLTVSTLFGFALECGMTIIESWLSLQKFTRYKSLDVILICAFTTYLVTLGIEKTGMFYNPAMASCHFLGCQGSTYLQHFLVYWVGPFVGIAIASLIDRYIHLPRDSSKKNSGKKQTDKNKPKSTDKGKNNNAKNKKVTNSGDSNAVNKKKKAIKDNVIPNEVSNKGSQDKGKQKNDKSKSDNNGKQQNNEKNTPKAAVKQNGIAKKQAVDSRNGSVKTPKSKNQSLLNGPTLANANVSGKKKQALAGNPSAKKNKQKDK